MGHGHVTPNPNGMKARCGGPKLCQICAREQALQVGLPPVKSEPPPMPEVKPAARPVDVDTRALEKRVAELERLVTILTRERDTRQPYASPGVPTPMWPIYPAPSANTCGRCGLKLEGVMGYVCPNGGNCPTGLGGSVCMG